MPSVIAYNTYTERVLAVGKEAYKMIGRNPDYISVVHPISEGVISDDDLARSMIREFILKVAGYQLIKPRIIICIPSYITDVESRAAADAARSAGARQVYMIQEPVSAAIGAGINILLDPLFIFVLDCRYRRRYYKCSHSINERYRSITYHKNCR